MESKFKGSNKDRRCKEAGCVNNIIALLNGITKFARSQNCGKFVDVDFDKFVDVSGNENFAKCFVRHLDPLWEKGEKVKVVFDYHFAVPQIKDIENPNGYNQYVVSPSLYPTSTSSKIISYFVRNNTISTTCGEIKSFLRTDYYSARAEVAYLRLVNVLRPIKDGEYSVIYLSPKIPMDSMIVDKNLLYDFDSKHRPIYHQPRLGW